MAKLLRGFRGYETNNDGIIEWARLIGSLLINFGAVEMQTYLWIEALTDDEQQVVEAAKKKFSDRRSIVVRLIKEKNYSPEIESEMLTAWGHSEVLSKFRNDLAHNPVILS